MLRLTNASLLLQAPRHQRAKARCRLHTVHTVRVHTHSHTARPFSLLALLSFLRLELGNLLLHPSLHPALQLRPIPQREKILEENKERRQEERLEKVVEQGRRPALVGSVADELGDPGDDVDSERPGRSGGPVGHGQVVHVGRGTEQHRDGEEAHDGLEEHVSDAIYYCRNRSGVKWQVLVLKGFRYVNDEGDVGGL